MRLIAKRKFIKKNKGVSAVIGMILIVALTVSLIAVAYAWVNGLIPTGSTASKVMQASFNKEIATNNVSFDIVSTDAGITWSNINATAVDTNGVVNYVTDYVSHSPAGQTEVKVGQTMYIDCPDGWSGSYTFKIMYNNKIIWESSDISL
jgi:FlaG/FlaF family flagellin (archaellin)